MNRRMKWFCLLFALSLLLPGCAGAPEASPGPTASAPPAGSPQATPAAPLAPTPASTLSPAPASAELRIMLPGEEGYRWQYFGFAEYGHEMTLDAISQGAEGTRYEITGEVYDMSDGESDRDFSLSVSYIVGGESIVQEKTAPMMMDTFARMELIRTPLVPGSSWQQTVRHDEGREVTLVCTIEAVEGNAGSRKYTVLYQDTEGGYYERREIADGMGVVSYEKLYMPEGDEPFPMGYSLYTED